MCRTHGYPPLEYGRRGILGRFIEGNLLEGVCRLMLATRSVRADSRT